MQIDGIRWCRYPTRAILAALLLSYAVQGVAQQPDRATLPLEPGTPIPGDYYRAEIVILERIIEPEAVNERMSGRTVEEPTDTEEVLWSALENGTTQTTLELAPRQDLRLASAAARLERSGRYRVLVAAGWYEAFPPDYEGTPLRVEAGNWIEGARTREVEGHITIDRQRYLHVNVHLNHWQLSEEAPALPEDAAADMSQETPSPAEASGTQDTTAAATDGESAAQQLTVLAEPAPLELLTWIRETRRMRSEEIHFLDSPTVGVLVFFKKIEATE
ncbi:5'-methylthioadenosine phosphorylase [Marinobacter maroccanus]|uniref:5'-methylthioadenosine phosphorylase n=1 Tax=Marinobacter maroccanus TaxID=2055143 RepID=A0A2S5ZFR6_9GAMM|nr:CsiV family protein [Marinobacter maroccanus]PPI86151.1 5'-methylthioadenosine phosphorylase [Marinobacter maroccanus]